MSGLRRNTATIDEIREDLKREIAGTSLLGSGDSSELCGREDRNPFAIRIASHCAASYGAQLRLCKRKASQALFLSKAACMILARITPRTRWRLLK